MPKRNRAREARRNATGMTLTEERRQRREDRGRDQERWRSIFPDWEQRARREATLKDLVRSYLRDEHCGCACLVGTVYPYDGTPCHSVELSAHYCARHRNLTYGPGGRAGYVYCELVLHEGMPPQFFGICSTRWGLVKQYYR